MTSPDPTLDLRQHLAAGEVAAFVGAGMSIGAQLPSWYDLIAELSARIGYELAPVKWATGDALIDAAQAYVNHQGLHSLISYLKDRLDTTGKQPTAAHRALARLPISLVFTANFDDLLERAYRDAGKRAEVVARDTSIPFMRRGPDTVNIVKLYGDLDQPDTIVLARQQYESYFLQRPQMVRLLETTLATSDMLYLGWSGNDPYFKMIFGELLSRFGGMMRPGYAVMFDVTDAQREELARQQIRLVELPAGDRAAALAAWLRGLSESLPQALAPAVFPIEFVIRGNWQVARVLAEVCVKQHQSIAIRDVELTYSSLDFATGNDEDWAEAVEATVDYLGRARTGKIGQVEFRALGNKATEGLVTLRVEERFAELTAPLFLEMLQAAKERGVLVETGSSSPAGSTAAGTSTQKWNTSAIRDLLRAAFGPDELTTLCFDNFPDVHEQFAPGMTKPQMIQLLLEYCIRNEQVAALLAAVQKANPAQYRRYEGQLRS